MSGLARVVARALGFTCVGARLSSGVSRKREWELSFPIPGSFSLPFALHQSTVALLGIPFGLGGETSREKEPAGGGEAELALGWQPTAWPSSLV